MYITFCILKIINISLKTKAALAKRIVLNTKILPSQCNQNPPTENLIFTIKK